MTAQLILINAHGVAIASDSAVTVGGGRRTHDTAEKVTPLRPPHRIAVLHSGSVMVHGLPYQLLLNEWMATIGDQVLPQVEDYRSGFLDWMANNSRLFSEERMAGDWIGYLSRRFEYIRSRVLEEVERAGSTFDPTSIALAEVRAWSDGLPTFAAFEGTDDEWLTEVARQLDQQIGETLEYWFDDIPRSAEIDALLYAYGREFFRRSVQHGYQATLAFVGFGEDQILPSYSLVNLIGVLNGRVMHTLGPTAVGDTKVSPFWDLMPLGQRSAMDLFLRGYDIEMLDVSTDAALGQLDALRRKVEQIVPDDVAMTGEFDDMFKNAAAALSETIEQTAIRHSDDRYVGPLGSAMAGLPTATMAEVVRSLVELQALRQTTTAEQSTVGGPIDVAIISRAGGFEWVRHKSRT